MDFFGLGLQTSTSQEINADWALTPIQWEVCYRPPQLCRVALGCTCGLVGWGFSLLGLAPWKGY